MNLKMYTIRDSKAEMYHPPQYLATHADAERWLKNIVTESPDKLPGIYRNIAKYPEDFDLYYLGEFDDGTGKVSSLDTPQHIIKATNVKQ